MPSIAGKLMADTADKNIIDKDEYPQTAAIEARCVNIIADLWHADLAEQATGCSTTGSSEAAMLGGLAMKWRWRERMRAAGKPTDKPNLVTGTNVQVCWEKFMRYWDVEPRLVPMEGDRYHLDPEDAVALCDENTIGVVGVLGSTFDGSYEPIKEIAAALDDLQERTGWTCRCMSTLPPADSSRRSCSLSSNGTSGSSACARSTPPVTSTGSSIPGSAGRSGETRRRSRGPDLRRQLPRRAHADVRTQLLAAGERGDRAVLHVRESRLRRLPASDAERPGRCAEALIRDRGDGALQADDEGRRAAGIRLHAQG